MIKFKNEDCLDTLRGMEDNSIDLIITSPPYNRGYYNAHKKKSKWDLCDTKSRVIDYGVFDDNMPPEEYEEWQREILTECCRVIKRTGSIFYNHKDVLWHHNTIHPKWVYDFPLKQIIVWDRVSTLPVDLSYFYPITEYVFWIKKDRDSKPYFDRHNALFQKNIWRINPEKNNPHPAAFPVELPQNIIAACSKEGDIVYDPFMGSGTTALAAKILNRNFIGSELNPDYIKMTEERLK